MRDSFTAPIPVVIAAERGEQRVIVIGSGGWMLTRIADAVTPIGGGRMALMHPGNLELLINTPVSSAELMVGKVAPYILIGLVQLALILGVGQLLFDVPVPAEVVQDEFTLSEADTVATDPAALARVLVATERASEAQPFFRRAEKLAVNAQERLDARAESDRLGVHVAKAPVLLEQSQRRRKLWRSLPAGDERAAWEAEGLLTEARLRFATGDYAGAAERFEAVPERSVPDTYLLAVAELRSGRWAEGIGRLQRLAEGNHPVFREMATERLAVVKTARQLRAVL